MKWDDTHNHYIYTLTDVLRAGKPGQKVKLVIVRGGKNIELEATLAERKG
jgi:S1-C subfamily serine protease